MMTIKKDLGIYIHFPYCTHHCVYCDFNVRELKQRIEIDSYVEVLQKEIQCYVKKIAKEYSIDSIFFGGGTPSLLSAELVRHLMLQFRSIYSLRESVEVTMEANPNSVTFSRLMSFREAGINRLSFGVQSFHEKHLKTLERVHSSRQAFEAVRLAYQTGFENINLDFIFGIPGQTLKEFQNDIFEALELHPSHLSTYQLSVAKNNPLYPYLLGENVCAQMYEWVIKYLPIQGYEHYEVSAFAKIGAQCRHNLKYWKLKDFLGFGVGAYSRLMTHENPWGIHLKNTDSLEEYRKCVIQSGMALEEEKPLSREEAEKDYFLACLRLLEGVSLEDYERRFKKILMISYSKQISSLLEQGLLDSSQKMLKLTSKGLLYLNQVLLEFV